MYEAELWVRLRFGRICRRSKLTMYAGTMMVVVVVHGCGAATRNRSTEHAATGCRGTNDSDSAALIANLQLALTRPASVRLNVG